MLAPKLGQAAFLYACAKMREMVGKYERGEAVPSIEAAKKIADAFEVSMVIWLAKV